MLLPLLRGCMLLLLLGLLSPQPPLLPLFAGLLGLLPPLLLPRLLLLLPMLVCASWACPCGCPPWACPCGCSLAHTAMAHARLAMSLVAMCCRL